MFLTIVSTTVNAQRFVKISNQEIKHLFFEDVDFWRNNIIVNMSDCKHSFIRINKEAEGEWSQSNISASDFKKISYAKDTIPTYDLNDGTIVGYSTSETPVVDLTYFVFSEHPELRNKIGIGFTSKPYLKDRIDTQFCFIDVSKKFKLKDERRLDFLKLLSFSLPNSEADSIVNMKLNNIQSSLHILDISNMDNDSLPALNHLISRLFRSYEVDFINKYYSGVNNSYEFSSDNWGNRATTSVKPAKYTVSVYDEDGIVSKKNVIPYSMNMIGVSLYFEKWSSNKKKRQVYPGIRYNVISTNGTHLGSASVYLHPSDIKHFKEESRVLFEYLSQIHN
jgi:hypothetical protein